MSIQNIRKAFILLFVDIVLLIGIFLLQFRTDSTIIQKIGNLQFTLAKAEGNADGFQNKLMASFNGMNIYCDDQNPAIVSLVNKAEPYPVAVKSFFQISDLAYEVDFTDNVSLVFSVTSLGADQGLSVKATLPASVKSFSIPFGYISNLEITKDDGNRLVLESRKNSWEVNANISDDYLTFTKNSMLASVSKFSKVEQFTFDSVTELAIADNSQYEANIEALKNNLIAAFKPNPNDSNLYEQSVVSYIACMAEKGQYSKAVDDIPQNYKHSKNRTYLSAPYLNSLNDMNNLLNQSIFEYQAQIDKAVEKNSLDVFAIRNVAFYMCIHPNPSNVRFILQAATAVDLTNASLTQVTGVIQAYCDFIKINSEYASILAPVIEGCVDRIAASCSLNSNFITISENDTFLSVNQAVEIGEALHRYGILAANETVRKAGIAIVNSYLSESSAFDLRTLSNIYPVIAYNNKYYPHFEIVGKDKDGLVWAWTCAKSISYEKVEKDIIEIDVKFPEGLTHYVIFKGIPSFNTIYIYNIPFRTDARFENYNSSGYVYKKGGGTLLLKSRHKAENEVIKLDLSSKPVEKPAPTVTAPAPAVVQPVEEVPAAAPVSAEPEAVSEM